MEKKQDRKKYVKPTQLRIGTIDVTLFESTHFDDKRYFETPRIYSGWITEHCFVTGLN